VGLAVAVVAGRVDDPAAVAVLALRKAARPNEDAASDGSAVLDDAANDEAVLMRTLP